MFKKSKVMRDIRKGLEDAQCLGVAIRNSGLKSYTTIERWRKRPLIDRYFNACINKSDKRRNDAVVDSLFKQAINGNPTCIAIYLKFKMGWQDSPLIDQSNHQHYEFSWKGNGAITNENRNRLLTPSKSGSDT